MRHSTAHRRLYDSTRVLLGSSRQRPHPWLPRRVLLVRHGESVANVDREVYSNTPDWKIPLTKRGEEQALNCGKRLRHIIQDEKLYIYYSPYVRTRQTLEHIRQSFDESQIQGEREDERLREQEIGNYQPMHSMDTTWAARNEFGRLYYRFPFGECGADVGDRVSCFFDSLLRESINLTVPNMNESAVYGTHAANNCHGRGKYNVAIDRLPCTNEHPISALDGNAFGGLCTEKRRGLSPPARSSRPLDAGAVDTRTEDIHRVSPAHASSLVDLEVGARGVLPPNDNGTNAVEDQNILIVSHGLLIRLFIGRWFRVPMEVYETMCNPPNCSIIVLERDDKLGRLVMTDISKSLFGSDPLLQMMRFDGREDTHWYRERFLGIIDPTKVMEEALAEDDDENHYSRSNAHNSGVGAPAPPLRRSKSATAASPSPSSFPRSAASPVSSLGNAHAGVARAILENGATAAGACAPLEADASGSPNAKLHRDDLTHQDRTERRNQR